MGRARRTRSRSGWTSSWRGAGPPPDGKKGGAFGFLQGVGGRGKGGVGGALFKEGGPGGGGGPPAPPPRRSTLGPDPRLAPPRPVGEAGGAAPPRPEGRPQ